MYIHVHVCSYADAQEYRRTTTLWASNSLLGLDVSLSPNSQDVFQPIPGTMVVELYGLVTSFSIAMSTTSCGRVELQGSPTRGWS